MTAILNVVDIPVQDDPGGLTRLEKESDRRQARARNLQFDGGEKVEQQKLGFIHHYEPSPEHTFQIRNYYVHRDFSNKLPFPSGGQVAFERHFFGGGAKYSYTLPRNRLTLGFDVDRQEDARKNFDNLNGTRGPLDLDQDEQVTSLGIYAQNEYELFEDLSLTGAIRYDRVEFEVEDQFLSDGDDSGAIRFTETSPFLGLSWEAFNNLRLYANYATSFETPTTTEFDNPNGGGFNQDLESQQATSYEIGAKGDFVNAPWPARFELALFTMDIEDALTPFQLQNFPGREFFRNAGESRRDGLEAALTLRPVESFSATFSYTYSDFEFENFETPSGNLKGNQLPGIPRNFGNIELSYTPPGGWFVTWNTRYTGSMYADDGNATKVDAYTVSDLRMGLERTFGSWTVSPFLGLNNVFDKEYDANIRINAFGGRFFEPAPERNLYGGLVVRYTWEN
ncbi:MAG: TonB-dependent receptor family protein [Opitutales bacterium]